MSHGGCAWGGAEAEVRPPEGIWMASALSYSEKERDEVYEKLWKQGGLTFYISFMDTTIDEDSNKTLQEFMRKKIRATVKDPKTAAALKPYYPYACKRPTFHDEFLPTFSVFNHGSLF